MMGKCEIMIFAQRDTMDRYEYPIVLISKYSPEKDQLVLIKEIKGTRISDCGDMFDFYIRWNSLIKKVSASYPNVKITNL